MGDELRQKPKKYLNLSPKYNKKDLRKITLQTKLEMREKQRKLLEGEDEEDKDKHSDGGNEKKVELSSDEEEDKNAKNEKVGLIGHFIQNKAMIFDSDANQLQPEKGHTGPKKLVDYNIIRKGLNQPSKKSKAAQQKEDEFLQEEEERIEKEEKEVAKKKKEMA